MQPGISAIAAYLPPYRVSLEQWCEWYDQPWPKIRSVVGRSFRVRGPRENVYTMAAEAALRLIEQNQIDPARIRYLALGTESSTDNSAGTVVVKGLLNQILPELGLNTISRHCEVPEFKHACLGGVYGLKGAARFLACEPDDSLALVISGDVAEYARGSSGEPTQGAGAVAMLLEKQPQLLELLLPWSGSASDYRLVDFRKPMSQVDARAARAHGQIRDFPVFNGHYSTSCYLDATLKAAEDLWRRRGLSPATWMANLKAVFMHRPYHRMPETGLALTWLAALAADPDPQPFDQLCADHELDASGMRAELAAAPNLLELVAAGTINADPYPLTLGAIRAVRGTSAWQQAVSDRLAAGSDTMRDIGNLYTAALPAWIGAGLEAARSAGDMLAAGDELLLAGYGSGDAAEAIPARMVPDWETAAGRIGVQAALAQAVDLSQTQYEMLHDRGDCLDLPVTATSRFLLDRIGEAHGEGGFEDAGIEYYRVSRAPDPVFAVSA
ncbi:MAG: hydroxymethylglutaryl-CoA synthase [Pseudomonadota bacterium]